MDTPAVNPDDDKYSEWRIKDAADTLVRAEEVKEDPKMFKLAKEHLAKTGRRLQKISSMADLRKVASDFEPDLGEETEEDSEE